MSERCKEQIYGKFGGFGSERCSRNAVNDGFCKQHHPDTIKARDEKSMDKYRLKLAKDPIMLAYKKVEELTQQRDALLTQLKTCEIALSFDNPETTLIAKISARNLISEIEAVK